ncbi:hypothetical protein [Chthoniobacter flavus]|uniref:hypothetical protein n=1 Tax=Chthoniobacter flavus TaxID=191863 RepID=UPI0012F8F44F|nr:hypothetical protein [Chthoniobacter flavus]
MLRRATTPAVLVIALFALAETSHAQVPAILRTSDAVAAGQPFRINGDGITTAAYVAVAPANGAAPATPPAGYSSPSIAQHDQTGKNHYVVATMPSLAAGVYNVWVNNGSGWSPKPFPMNRARPLFMSEYQAYAGFQIEVAGRNFDLHEFGGTTTTLVRLRNSTNGTTIPATIVNGSLNPAHLTFTVPTATVNAQYYVDVSNNNGVDWGTLDNGQLLQIVAIPPAGSDPLGMGVVWAKDFRWATVKNVTQPPYNINPADTTGPGDNAAVQQAVDDASAAGGGVVYLPAGNYYLSFITLGPGVVLKGDGDSTKIYYIGAGGSSFVRSKRTNEMAAGQKPELQGLANLSIQLSNQSVRPDVFISLGDFSVPNDQRVGNRLFALNVQLNYDYTAEGASGQRGIGFLATGLERMLVQGCDFVGRRATILSSYVAKYFNLRNNHFEYSSGYVHGSSTFSFYENNDVIAHSGYGAESHGLFARSDAYVANNYVEGTGGPANTYNDGESICNEASGYANFNFGAVTSATATTLVVNSPDVTLVAPVNLYYGDLSVLITEGAGIGQLRKVSVNPATNTFTITGDKPFDIIPDHTSRWTLYAPLRNFTIYQNTFANCAKGIWLYGNAYDDYVAENTSINSAGIYLHCTSGSTGTNPAVGVDKQGYFTRIAHNTVRGLSRWGNYAGIGLNTGRWNSGGSYLSTQAYGTEIIDNVIIGDRNAATNGTTYPGEMGPYSGVYVISYGFSNPSNGVGTGDATDTIIYGNQLSNLKFGINLSRADSGNLLSTNRYDSLVTTFLNEANPQSDNTMQLNNTSGTIAATAPIFQEDFNNNTSATGGSMLLNPNNKAPLVTTINSSPTMGAGTFLKAAITSSTAAQNIAQFTPASLVANSWAAMAQGTANGWSNVNINGGLDLFVRPNSVPSGDQSWFRPVDVDNRSSGGLRIILTGAGNSLQLQLVAPTGVNAFSTDGVTYNLNTVVTTPGYVLTPGAVYHIGFTLNTAASGQVTARLFAVANNGAINTASTPLASMTFYVSAALIPAVDAFSGQNWTMSARGTSPFSDNVDYDQVRLFNSDPGIFPAAQ